MPHDWLDLLSSEWWSLLGATAAHLELVVEAVTLAVLVGVPLGILAARGRSWNGPPSVSRACSRPSPAWPCSGFS